MSSDDGPLPEDDAIAAAHPLRTGRYHLYDEAMRLVGARHTKAGLVELVNWLLDRIEAQEMTKLARRPYCCACQHAAMGSCVGAAPHTCGTVAP